jgi:hypothetical protein
MKTKLFFITMLAIIGLSAKAQWQGTGLDSISVNCLTISGNNIFAGTDGKGVYLSSNTGGSWTPVNTGLPSNAKVNALGISGNNIFAGTTQGVYLSSNTGGSWSAVNTGLTNTWIVELVTSGNNIFAGTYDGGVFLSSNNGGNWAPVNTGLTNDTIYSLAVKEDTVFAGTMSGGIFKSSNNGSSWAPANTGLYYHNGINAIAISGNDIFAATEGGGVYLSSNNGSSWAPVNTGLTSTNILSLAITGDTILAGHSGEVFYSLNNGNNWVLKNGGLPVNANIMAFAIHGGYIFAGAYVGFSGGDGVFKLSLSALGIEEMNNNESNIAVYPNPAINNITIESLQKSTLEISNIQGQTILQQQIQQGKTDIDISRLAKGVYILRLCSNDKTEVTRIVKE